MGREKERVWKEKEEDFSPRSSLRDEKIFVARERGRETKLERREERREKRVREKKE